MGNLAELLENDTEVLFGDAQISQAICHHRSQSGINGPLFIGIDTHALSEPALVSALEVLAANDENRKSGLADGIVITPSHNPPEDGGFKYNPPNGGPADTNVTTWIEQTANTILERNLYDVRRLPYERARKAPSVHRHDYIGSYVADLMNVVDMEAIRLSGVKIGIDPLGGACVHYWQPIIERYGIAATVVSDAIDPTFRFMTVDWDGKIRMDCSSPYAMARLIGMSDKFDVAFANDTDADRHGIVTRSSGLMNPNHYLAAAISYLYENRPDWSRGCAVGKTVVSSGIIDRVTAKLGRSSSNPANRTVWRVHRVPGQSAAGGASCASGVTAKSWIRYRAFAAASGQVADGAATA
jgi:phosphoglucomutase